MNVLVACEESQRVCTAFRERGHRAFSCDLLPCSGEHPEWHIQADVLPLLNGDCCFVTMDGETHFVDGAWDVIIAHPPCTYLTVTGNRWFTSEYVNRFPRRPEQRLEAVMFFSAFVFADCPRIAIENPVGVMSSAYRPPDQYIEPYFFGDPEKKKTGLWLKGLPLLVADDVVEPVLVCCASGKNEPRWHMESMSLSPDERSRFRSQTFPGIARAMAEQWG